MNIPPCHGDIELDYTSQIWTRPYLHQALDSYARSLQGWLRSGVYAFIRYPLITCFRLVVIKDPCRCLSGGIHPHLYSNHSTISSTQMSPLSAFKRLSISSIKVSVWWNNAKGFSQSCAFHYQSAKSSNCSVPVNDHPSPLDITFALVGQTYLPSLLL